MRWIGSWNKGNEKALAVAKFLALRQTFCIIFFVLTKKMFPFKFFQDSLTDCARRVIEHCNEKTFKIENFSLYDYAGYECHKNTK